jgi:hypothetical protein
MLISVPDFEEPVNGILVDLGYAKLDKYIK